jgi:hypothetical protein
LKASFELENIMKRFTPRDRNSAETKLDHEPLPVRQEPTRQARCARMKVPLPIAAAACVLTALLAAGLFVGGCAAPSASSSAPKPGKGIAEYRQVAREAHQAVTATVKSIEGLTLPPTQTSVPPGALARFDKSFAQLELTSVKARARAEAIIARGQAYFEEWKGNLAALTNQAVAKVETERYAKLLDHFNSVRQRSTEVREEFRPFMAALRGFRASLDPNPATLSTPTAQKRLVELTAGGKRVLQALESISNALDAAEAELHTTLAAKR